MSIAEASQGRSSTISSDSFMTAAILRTDSVTGVGSPKLTSGFSAPSATVATAPLTVSDSTKYVTAERLVVSWPSRSAITRRRRGPSYRRSWTSASAPDTPDGVTIGDAAAFEKVPRFSENRPPDLTPRSRIPLAANSPRLFAGASSPSPSAPWRAPMLFTLAWNASASLRAFSVSSISSARADARLSASAFPASTFARSPSASLRSFSSFSLRFILPPLFVFQQ